MLIHPTYHVLAQLISVCLFGVSLLTWVYYSCIHSSQKPRSSYFAGAMDAIGYTRRTVQIGRSRSGTATGREGRPSRETKTKEELLGVSLDKDEPVAHVTSDKCRTAAAGATPAASSIADAATPAAGNGDPDDDDAEDWLQVTGQRAMSPVQLVRKDSYLRRYAKLCCAMSIMLTVPYG
jgi:hypothetical protein